jgi:quercetin dioxygenase-like cupin family protein
MLTARFASRSIATEEAMNSTEPVEPTCDEPWVGNLNELVQFADRGIVSKTLVDCPNTNVSLFALRTGQRMSGHASRWPATIQVMSGEGKIQIGESEHEGKPGSLFYMPAHTYHALASTDNLVFLLSLFK